MAVRQDTIWERFLKPIAQILIDGDELKQLSRSFDWEREIDRLGQAGLAYPDYYRSQNFHGLEGGYLTPGAAVTYDPITQYVLPPHETWVRQAAIAAIEGQPRRILDLGCGTGSTTLRLKKAFPQARVTGLDLSPYMLVMAEHKAQQAGLDVQWQHGMAEETPWDGAGFDLVTASLLFHETPPSVAGSILRECFRLLVPGGQVVILDGNQKVLRETEWLTEIFEEPYIKAYAREEVSDWMSSAGFEGVRTEEFWWLHQVSCGFKPLPLHSSPDPAIELDAIPGLAPIAAL